MVHIPSEKRVNAPGIGKTAKFALFEYETWPKRTVDIFIACLLVPFVAPLVGFLWCMARLGGGPGFFGHERVGRDGSRFKCWKIRTMVPDADARLKELLARDPEARAEWERDHKLKNDPRVTRYGQFLRKTSMDELPQLFNVLRGDMSLIGPRPVPEEELTNYGASSWAYLTLRPGITGLWQVSGRNDVTYEERVELDVLYRETLSLGKDLGILGRTVVEVLRRSGR